MSSVSTAVVDVPRVVVQSDPRLTVLTSLIELFGPLRARLPSSVVARARVLAHGVPMQELLAPYAAVDCYCPDFLSRSMEPLRSFDEQLEVLRETPDGVVTRDLARDEEFVSSPHGLVASRHVDAPGGAASSRHKYWDAWRDNPRRHLGRYCSLLQQYRTTVLDAIYPNFESLLRRESHRLEQATSEWGPEISIGRVHPDIRFMNGTLVYDKSQAVIQPGWSPDALIVKPMLCSSSTRLSDLGYCSFTGAAQAVIGVATGLLREGGVQPTRQADHLDTLLGQARAQILRSLRRLPGTTTDLAGELGYAPSSISYHLKAFSRAGVVQNHRSGGSVCYHLTPRGDALARL